MARRIRDITELYGETLKKISKSPDEWLSFMECAAMNYKYSFSDQALIYAQKPETVACAEIETWNRSFKRWVNKGATGIALLTEKNGYPFLRYVFDVSDTNSRLGKNFLLWTVTKAYEENVIEALENRYGELENKTSLATAIISSAYNMVEDNLPDYLEDLKQFSDNSMLGSQDDNHIKATYQTLLSNSVAFMMMKRCGIDPTEYFKADDFKDIQEFNTYDTITRLGVATSDISEMGLREIYATIKNVRKNEIDKIRTFDKEKQIDYDISENRNIESERSEEYAKSNLHNAGRLQNTRPNVATEREERSQWEIRIDEAKLPKRTQESIIHNTPNERPVDGTSIRDTGTIRNESGTISITDDDKREYQRGIETTRPDEVGRLNEQLEDDSRGDNNERTNLQLGVFDKDSNHCPYVVIDAKVNQILSSANLKVTNEEIRNYFETEKDKTKRAEYLKNAFDNVYVGIYVGTELYGYKAFDNGLLIWKGNFLSRDTESFISWEDLTEHYNSMILLKQLYDRKQKLPTEKEQLSLLDLTEEQERPELEFSQEFIDTFFQEQNSERKYYIYRQLQSSLSTSDNITFLKNLYGISGSSHTVKGSGVGFNSNGKGITLYRGYEADEIEILLKWNTIEKRLKELISLDRYLNPKEKEYYPTWLEKYENSQREEYKEENVLEQEEQNDIEIVEQQEDFIEEYEYHLGDKVYIGAEEYEILSFDENTVSLYDYQYPLFNKEMTREEFDRKVQENPANDHLKVKKSKTVEEITPKEETKEEIQEQTSQVDDLVGEHLTIDNREFIVDTIHNDRVSLRDVTFQGATGFPIFREENIDYVKELLTEKEKTEFVPAFEKRKKSKVTTFDLHPEIKNEDRHNFHITDDMLGVGTDREKFNRNVEAIKVLKLCEKENRFATPEEQKVLSQYVGWGGLPQAFDEKNSSWASEYLELKNLLDEDEYKSAMESTLTAFYTPPVVIRTMYKALEQMGMKTANILEPACGTGNFIGMLPETLNECKLYGVELDKISGKIAQQLYQKSSIAVQGFENIALPDSFFDGCIGNVPFGDFKLLDKKYDKHNFLIHDYFFAKAIDKVRPGGVIAFITSKGTLDKESSAVRKYIAQRADLLGAIRLPDNTFKANAGTKVTSDIIFLQKRDSITDLEPEWVHLDINEDGIKMNKYFIDHPEMICGNMVMESTQFGMDSACKANEDTTLEEQLNKAIQNIHAEIKEYEFDDIEENEEDLSIPADVSVRNFSYTLVDNKIYYRENSRMYPQELPLTAQNRIKGLIEIRDCVRTLIELQTEDYPDEDIKQEQRKLNVLYDNFTKKYGLINSRANTSAFSNDNSFYLLCSLEILDENKELKCKADMFTKRTIKPNIEITKVDTAQEALVVSISEKARVDLDYMQKLTGMDMDKMIEDLEGQIFNVPTYGNPNIWVTADEYLSGNVREKLKIAEEFSKTDLRFETNVKHLKEVQPKDLEASEIAVRLGATWLPPEDIEEFMWYLLTPSWYVKDSVKVHYMESTAQWSIENKNYDRGNVKANSTFGTHRVNAYKIIEETLNLKDVRVYDYTIDDEGKRVPELNKKETAIAQAKQEQIKSAFEEWIWTDPERRQRLCKIYNEKFNSIRPREFDGSHIRFNGMNPEIKLRKHQINGVARILYGGNTLLAHEVGAGKTFTMVAAAMEAKRLGLCNKSMFVVPNHIVEQFSSEFLQLYPSANILVTTKKDFETGNRKKFCSRIATGDYDAVIISHSQFEKIPMSAERQIQILQKQIDDIMRSITDLKENHGERFTIKQLMKTQKSLETKLKKLNDTSRKDDVVTFEELGVDRIFVDEAHYYKNLFLYTKMRNVGGIAQTEAQKSSDLYMKCRYLDELTGGKGVTFATGTPVSNSMVELYTMQRYLQYAELEKRNLQNFDAWASTFGETVTAIELAPEGTGYRAKTRFAKFYNLPELLAMFKEVADIQTSDMLNLPVPKANYENVVVKPTELQKEMVAELAERAERVRNKMVDSSIDNMLKITNDGRKLALDQRLMNEILPDDPNSKVATCAKNIYRIWEENKDQKLTQLVFCDLSTPHNDGKFNVYDDLKKKLEEMGVPEDEVQFIHYANTDIRKKELFAKVRKGITRVLMGSTQKMGAGTNCQDKLIALHDLDCPWRPSDLIQRSGRIIRQGNNNPEVFIYRYVTEGTFDAYLYQLVENKQRFISQIMTSKTPVRSAEDIDETALSYAEIKSLASGNPLIIEKTELDTEVAKLKLLKQSHLSQIYAIEDKIIKYYPNEIKRLETKKLDLKEDIGLLNSHLQTEEIKFDSMVIKDKTYTDRMEAGNKILEICKGMTNPEPIELGEYKGFKTSIEFDKIGRTFNLILKNKLSYEVSLGTDPSGNITRIDNKLKDINEILKDTITSLEDTKLQFENAKEEAKRPFKQEQELKEKSKRLDELNIKLNMNDKGKEVIDFSDNEEVECQTYEKAYAR